MGTQDSATQEILRLAREQNAMSAKLQPLQEEALRFGLDSNKTAYEQSQADRGWLLGRRDQLTGLQDTMAKEASTFNSDAEGARRAAAAGTDVTKAFGDQQAAEGRALAGMGVAPGSGRYLAMREARGVDQARATVGAANEARLGARNEGRYLVDRAANTLAGYPAGAAGATTSGANIGAGGVSTANAGAGGIYSGYGAMTGAQQAAGGVAGQMGSNATGMYGVESNAYGQAKNSKNEMIGAGVGAVATVAAAFI